MARWRNRRLWALFVATVVAITIPQASALGHTPVANGSKNYNQNLTLYVTALAMWSIEERLRDTSKEPIGLWVGGVLTGALGLLLVSGPPVLLREGVRRPRSLRAGPYRVRGKPRSTLEVAGSGQREVTTLPRV